MKKAIKYVLFAVAVLVFFRTASTFILDGLTLLGLLAGIEVCRLQYLADNQK